MKKNKLIDSINDNKHDYLKQRLQKNKSCSNCKIGIDNRTVLFNAIDNNNFKTGLAALDSIRKNRCEFIVVGRLDEFGNFRNAKDISIPDGYDDMFIMIEEEKFRSDISSTDFRIQN